MKSNDFQMILYSIPLRYRMAAELWTDGWAYHEVAAHLEISSRQARRLLELGFGHVLGRCGKKTCDDWVYSGRIRNRTLSPLPRDVEYDRWRLS